MRSLLAALLALSLCEARADNTDLTDSEAYPMNQTHHVIDYIEFKVTDMQAARRFYSQAFDWRFTDYGPDYVGIQKPDGQGEVGGLLLADSVGSGGPLVILYSTDLEATLQRVINAGGKIVAEPFQFPGGRRFQFTDPSGNELGVWTDR